MSNTIEITNKINVQRIPSADVSNWYKATAILPNGSQAIGFGTTHTNAITDCMRDIYILKQLQANK